KITGGRIESVRIIRHNENLPGNSFSVIPQKIVDAQGVEGIDAATQATLTSNALLRATAQALEKASVKSLAASEKEEHIKKSLGANHFTPAPVWVIGSYDEEGKPNVMTASWAGICCSDPPCVTVSLRKATYTYGNIMKRKAYTVNVPSEAFLKETDYFGLVSGRDTNKFKDTNLTPVKSNLVDAPYIKEFPLVLECNLLHAYEIGLHTMFVGEIKDVKADKSVLSEGDLIDMEKLKPIIYLPKDSNYYKTGEKIGKGFSIGKELMK
ncbi:flavin reductase, partial [Candidatus Sumerlaeota bacterium]|nr:flavin reductase [Candidatus Sumerlaeota bacterium]